jgi:hypothetical protein
MPDYNSARAVLVDETAGDVVALSTARERTVDHA